MPSLVQAAIVFSLSATAALAQPRDRLVIGLGSFPATMHPTVPGQASRNYILAAARRAVTRFDEGSNIICQLCTDIPSITNGRAKIVDLPNGSKGMEVTFTLRPDLKWGDGTKLTTRDISFGAEVAHSVNPPLNVAGVVVRDEHTYTVMLNAVRYDYNQLSPDPLNAAIEEPIFRSAKDPLDYANKSGFNHAPDQPGLWNGPYLITEFKPNESITFAPNPYWLGEKPGFKQVTMRLISSSAALEANMLSGDVDIGYGLGSDQVADLQKNYASRFDFASFPDTPLTFYLILQNNNPILADKRVRQAIAMGIDKQGIVDHLLGGGVPVANSIVATADPNYNKDLQPWPYDPARARANLMDAGYKPGPDGIMLAADGARLSLDLIVGSGAGTAGLLQQAIQSELKQIGIEVVAKSEPFRVLDGTTLPRRTFKGMVIEWYYPAPGTIPIRYFGSVSIPRESNAFSGANYTGYSNPRMDTLLNSAVVELDPAKRQVLWNEIQSLVMDDLPQIPLIGNKSAYISPKWMTGLTPPHSVTAVAPLWIEYWKPKQPL